MRQCIGWHTILRPFLRSFSFMNFLVFSKNLATATITSFGNLFVSIIVNCFQADTWTIQQTFISNPSKSNTVFWTQRDGVKHSNICIHQGNVPIYIKENWNLIFKKDVTYKSYSLLYSHFFWNTITWGSHKQQTFR